MRKGMILPAAVLFFVGFWMFALVLIAVKQGCNYQYQPQVGRWLMFASLAIGSFACVVHSLPKLLHLDIVLRWLERCRLMPDLPSNAHPGKQLIADSLYWL